MPTYIFPLILSLLSETILCLSLQRIVSGADDRTVRVWNAETGECMYYLQVRTDRLWGGGGK